MILRGAETLKPDGEGTRTLLHGLSCPAGSYLFSKVDNDRNEVNG